MCVCTSHTERQQPLRVHLCTLLHEPPTPVVARATLSLLTLHLGLRVTGLLFASIVACESLLMCIFSVLIISLPSLLCSQPCTSPIGSAGAEPTVVTALPPGL